MELRIDGPDQILYQWDTGQRLILIGFSGTLRVIFAWSAQSVGTPADVYTEGSEMYCDIPDSILMEHGTLMAYVRQEDGERGETIFSHSIRVFASPRPSDYVDPENVPTWRALEQQLGALSAQIEELKKSGGGTDLGITGATVGQVARITAVDDNGKPTEWQSVAPYYTVEVPVMTISSKTCPVTATDTGAYIWEISIADYAIQALGLTHENCMVSIWRVYNGVVEAYYQADVGQYQITYDDGDGGVVIETRTPVYLLWNLKRDENGNYVSDKSAGQYGKLNIWAPQLSSLEQAQNGELVIQLSRIDRNPVSFGL